MPEKILEIQHLKKYFSIKGLLERNIGDVKAVDGVDFHISKGEIFGLVGESGCGKTTLGRCTLTILEPTAGEIPFQGNSLTQLKGPILNKVRRNMAIVFQNPFMSLNPRMRIRDIVAEPIKTHDTQRIRNA